MKKWIPSKFSLPFSCLCHVWENSWGCQKRFIICECLSNDVNNTILRLWMLLNTVHLYSFNNVTPIALAWQICHRFLLPLPSFLSSFSRTTLCNNPPFYSRFSSLLSLMMFISNSSPTLYYLKICIIRQTFHKYHDVQLGKLICYSIKEYL